MIIQQRPRILLVAGLLLALVALASASPAAGQSIPRFVDTGEYKSLQSNVLFLQGRATVPAAETTISEYRSGLETRVTKANERLEKLFLRHKNATDNKIKRQRKKAVKKVRKKESQRLARAAASKNRQLAQARSTYRQKRAQISNKYDRRINALQRTINKLKKDRRQTRNPRKLAIINDRIKESQVLIQNLRQDSGAEQRKAQKALRSAARRARQDFERRRGQIKSSAQAQTKKIAADYKQRRQRQMDSNRQRRNSDRQRVNNLQQQGTAAIDTMPVII
jgi:hypothetical protein